MTPFILHAPCYDILPTPNGYWSTATHAVQHLDNSGKILHRYAIHNPSGLCAHAPSGTVGVLDTGGRFFRICTSPNRVEKLDKTEQCEAGRPLLIGSRMVWAQKNGVVRAYNFQSERLERIADLGENVYAGGLDYDPAQNKLCILFHRHLHGLKSFFITPQTLFAAVVLSSGRVQMHEFPFRAPKELHRICLWNSDYICLRTRHPVLYQIASADFRIQRARKLPAKMWAVQGLFCDPVRNAVYIWRSDAVCKVDLSSFSAQILWEDRYISDVSVAPNGDVCIGTWEKGVVLRAE